MSREAAQRRWMLCVGMASAGCAALLLGCCLLGGGVHALPNALRWPTRLLALLGGSLGAALLLLSMWPLLRWLLEGLKKADGRFDPVLTWIFSGILGIMIWNSAVHDPKMNPDWARHVHNVEAWAELHLLSPEESKGSYYAPLAYWPPAAMIRLGFSRYAAVRMAQLLNVVYGALTLLLMLRMVMLVSGHKVGVRRVAMGTIAILPLWYKSFSMQRPEPLLALLAAAVMLLALHIFGHKDVPLGLFLTFGAAMGLAMLARQWAGCLLPGFFVGLGFVWSRTQRVPWKHLGGLTAAVVVSVVVSGWFYYSVYKRHGTVFAGGARGEESLIKDVGQAVLTDLWSPYFLSAPVAWLLEHRFWPILYSEIWGDYYGYWFYPRQTNLSEETLRSGSVPDYSSLGRANLAGLIPTVFLLTAIALTLPRRDDDPRGAWESRLILLGATVGSFAGLLIFAVTLPLPNGIQPLYVLQMFPFIAVLAADGWSKMYSKRPRFALVFLSVAGTSAVYN